MGKVTNVIMEIMMMIMRIRRMNEDWLLWTNWLYLSFFCSFFMLYELWTRDMYLLGGIVDNFIFSFRNFDLYML